jgi:hypothetical protein
MPTTSAGAWGVSDIEGLEFEGVRRTELPRSKSSQDFNFDVVDQATWRKVMS